MAHHQRHNHKYDSHVPSISTNHGILPVSPVMSPISEDEPAAELDEPDETKQPIFVKTRPRLGDMQRTESLLTRAFHHTDSESHDDDHHKLRSILNHNPSISSTCSTFSGRSAGDFTSDDGHTSPGTRASTPSSPRLSVGFAKQPQTTERTIPKISFPSRQGSESSRSSTTEPVIKQNEPTVEAELGRRRCISFVCGRKDTTTSVLATTIKEAPPIAAMEPPKRQCAIKFLCPSKAPNPKSSAADIHLRRPSPAPLVAQPPQLIQKRVHRDSDATIKNESSVSGSPAIKSIKERDSDDEDVDGTEATRFHEFAGEGDDAEDWIRQSTCHRSRLTVSDTLKKENDIRRLAEEAEAEAIEEDEEAEDDDDIDDAQTDFFSGEEEDAGFQTDDEEGFAASDDDSDDGSDYEWWAPRRTPTMSPFVSSKFFRATPRRDGSIGSIASTSENVSPTERPQKSRKKKIVSSVVIRAIATELPDSTDFVCGTLDEDRPLEQAYLNNRKQREAAKHRAVPQDIDPTFPTSDPEVEKDDEDDEDDDDELTDQSDEVDDIPDHLSESDTWAPKHVDHENDSIRGRKHISHKRSPHHSPRRLRSPPAPALASKRGRSPAPRGMFHHSPGRMRSPPPPNRMTSPPPSRRGSTFASPPQAAPLQFGQTLLGARNHDLTHTASLPRSPHPFLRRRRSSNMTARCASPNRAGSDEDVDDDVSLGDQPYTRSAIDIVQGLEQKRLKRREKLYKQYWKREEKKKHHRRPQPGKGAERMKQVGIECAIYRGKRILSI